MGECRSGGWSGRAAEVAIGPPMQTPGAAEMSSWQRARWALASELKAVGISSLHSGSGHPHESQEPRHRRSCTGRTR